MLVYESRVNLTGKIRTYYGVTLRSGQGCILKKVLIKFNMTPCALFAKRNLMEAIHDGIFFTRSLSKDDVFGLSLKASLLHSILEVPFEASLQLPQRIMIQLVHRCQYLMTNRKTLENQIWDMVENLHQKTRKRFNIEWRFCSVINCAKCSSVGGDKVTLQT